MQEDINSMISDGLQTTKDIIKAERENTQRTKTAVWSGICQRRTPKVILEDVQPRLIPNHIQISKNRSSKKEKKKEICCLLNANKKQKCEIFQLNKKNISGKKIIVTFLRYKYFFRIFHIKYFS